MIEDNPRVYKIKQSCPVCDSSMERTDLGIVAEELRFKCTECGTIEWLI